MDKIYIKGGYEESFLIDHGKDIKTVIIPNGTHNYDVSGLLLMHCPNIENFICESNDFTFKNGILFCNNHDAAKTRDLVYVTKGVKVLRIDKDINYIYSLNYVEQISVEDGNPNYSAIDNILFNKEKTEVLYICSSSTNVTIPEGVTKIQSDAFKDCDNLKRVSFPSSYNWSWGEELVFSDKVIDLDLLVNDSQAKFENGIVISDYDKSYAKARLYVGDIERCIIPSCLTAKFIKAEPFKKVKNFEVDKRNPELMAVDGVVLDKTGNRLVLYPPGRDYFAIPDTVTIIGDSAAAYNKKLKEVIIPKQVKTIESYAFGFDAKLEKVSLLNPDTTIDATSFSCCNLKLNEGVLYVGNYATGIDHYSNKEINIREGTTEIWDGRHPDEAGWVTINPLKEKKPASLKIPSTLKTIKGHLNSPYKEFVVSETNPYFKSKDGVLFSNDMKELIRYPEKKKGETYIVPAGVEVISDCAFHNCEFLNHIVLPESVKTIGIHAFSYTKLLTLELVAQPIEIKKLAITPATYHKYGGKSVDYVSTLLFRKGEIKIPVKVANNWEVNNDELQLSEFIKTESETRKEVIFNDIKVSGYKVFMAIYLYLFYKNDDCKKYLSRVKKKILEDPLYCEFLDAVKDDNDWTFLSVKSESKKSSIQKPDENKIGDVISFGSYNWGESTAPIEWFIVDSTKNQYLLLSKYLVKYMPFYGEKRQKKEFIGWSRSDVRRWLNGKFFETSFSEAERNRIVLKRIKNKGDVDTEDYIFIPSENEFLKYVETPRLEEEILQFEYGTERSLGTSEILRKTWMKYSDCCIEVRTAQIDYFTHKPSYMHQYGRVEYSNFIRPMMWVSKDTTAKVEKSVQKEPNKTKKEQIIKSSKEAVLSKWALNDLNDGTFIIEKYKGKDAVIEVPETYKGIPITVIGKSAFSGNRAVSCKNIEKVIIPEGITNIGESAFENCEKLKEIVLPNSLISIGNAAFAKTNISNIVIPNSVINIGAKAFSGCKKLTSVILSQNLTEVSSYLFQQCPKLENISLGDSIKTIGDSAFYGCPFVEISLPDGIESIGTSAFYTCKKLRKIKMPAGLKYIGMNAFGYCESLESLYIPRNTLIEDNKISPAFHHCYKLKNFSVDSESERYTDVDGVLFDKSKKILVGYPNDKGTTYEVPEGTEVIGDFAFKSCNNISSVYLPDSVKIIGFESFCGCNNLAEINIPNKLETIGHQAFAITGLKSVILPNSIKEIEGNPFMLCDAKIYAPEGSYAEEYCLKKGIPVIISDET